MNEFLIIWFVLGAILAPFSYAMNLAYFQGKYKSIAKEIYEDNVSLSVLVGMLTFTVPLIFVLSIVLTDFAKHGLKWK